MSCLAAYRWAMAGPASLPTEIGAVNVALAVPASDCALPGRAECIECAPVEATAQPERNGVALATEPYRKREALSSNAVRTTVVGTFGVNRDGTPKAGAITMTGYRDGRKDAAADKFVVARRAILRCSGRAYPLPRKKHLDWKHTEMTFNPERMRII